MTQTHEGRLVADGTAAERAEAVAAPALWRLAGVLAIAHVVLLFAGFSQEKSVVLGDSPATVARTYGSGSLERIFAGGLVEALSFVVLLPALAFIARVIGRRTEGGRWAGQAAFAAGITYVAVTLATGLPAGAAAVYGAHHGIGDPQTLALVNDVRTLAFFLSLVALAGYSICLGLSALADEARARWMGWGGLLIGGLLLVGLATEKWTDGANLASTLWMAWWVGVGVVLIRRAAPRTT
jgi:hypothetical protein